jgi:cell wall assembly regulator SMI1
MPQVVSPGVRRFASLLESDPALAARFSPPVAEIEAAQSLESLGVEVPQALRDLYRICDGNVSGHMDDAGTYVPAANLFEQSGVRLLHVAKISRIKNDLDRDAASYESLDAEHRAQVYSHGFWHRSWIPLAIADYDIYALATRPCFGGPAGQVIRFGFKDGTEWHVVAPSLDALLVMFDSEFRVDDYDRETLAAQNPGAREIEHVSGEGGEDRFDRPGTLVVDLLASFARATPHSSPSTLDRVDELARSRGRDVAAARDAVRAAVQLRSQEVFGERRRVDVLAETGELELHLLVNVVETVEMPGLEVSVAGVDAAMGEGAGTAGDELLFQVFFLPGAEEAAREMEDSFGALLALDEAFTASVARWRAIYPQVVADALATI